ncbi:hypothetical protein [Arenibacter certesii]|uniref:Uncharacterized protein n=1 Tax=Arenibacter certesii TaxID=228955 RepID=A0A918MPZ3_9FLAO|nr:hypothetical protein [Arenibacter certesii]GGW48730.1 hypothetical protein GCM10007383_35960 [Arenibacter certesii]
MKTLKEQCNISNVQLKEDLSINLTIELTGELLRIRNEENTLPIAHLYYYGDDGSKGDQLLHKDDSYHIKLSQSSLIKDNTIISNFLPLDLANEDKVGKDEIYVIFYLTMTFKTMEGVAIDAMITDLVRTNTIRKEFKK